MANALYALYKQSRLTQSPSIDLGTDDIKTVLVRSYVPDLAVHQYLSDVTGAGGVLVATSANMGGKTTALGVFDANDINFAAVAAGAACPYVIIYKDTGVPGTSPVIALVDTATNLPVTPNGGDIDILWDNGANKIFSL